MITGFIIGVLTTSLVVWVAASVRKAKLAPKKLLGDW